MRRNIFVFSVLFALSLFSFSCLAQTNEDEIIPITVGDLEKFKNFSGDEKWDFIIDFYKKNKKKGATDGRILNELLKLDAGNDEDSSIIKLLSDLEKRYKGMRRFVKNAIEEINVDILESNPGKTEYIIDPNDAGTWKNLKHFKIGKIDIDDYLNVFKKDVYFSNSVSSDAYSALLASCADRGNGEVLMAFILLPQDGGVFLTQREGEAVTGIKADFSGSENLTFDPIRYPFENRLNINGKTSFGYDGKVYLPFLAKLNDKEKNGRVKAVLSAEVCKDGVCRTQKSDTIIYETKRSSLEASGCSTIKQHMSSAPLSQKSGLELKKAFFKEEDGKVDLFLVFDMPAFGGKSPSVLVKNEQGLLFSKPFVSWDGDDMLIKIRLLNPEKPDKEARLTINVGYSGRASEFTVTVKPEQMPEKTFLSVFSFSISDSLLAFLNGIKFLFLTPVFAAFLMLGYQAAFVDRKTPEKTVSFYNGLGNMTYFWCVVCLIGGLVWFYVLPADLFWGTQFRSPLMNYLFFLLFSGLAVSAPKVFDDVTVARISERFPKPFSVFKAENIREKAGLIVGFITGCLLFITPMTHMYYDIYELLSRSALLYFVLFAAGVSLPFTVLSLYDKRAAGIVADGRTEKLMKMILPLPLYFQAALLAALIAAQAGAAVFLISTVLTALIFVCLKKAPFSKVFPLLAVIMIIAAVFIPFRPNGHDLNEQGGTAFDETLLADRIREGKAVYLNVTESFCLSCHFNRLVMIKRGGASEIQSGALTVMRAGYQEPFVKRLMGQGGKYNLPLNIMFSPSYPEGKIIDSVLSPWSAREEVLDAVSLRENEPDRQSALEQNQPDPAAKGTD